jgi:hypothetical protein
VEIMRSDQRISQSKIPDFMSAMFEKSDNLRDAYQRPMEPDELFQSDYRHVSQKATCQLCDKTKLVHRPHRKPIPRIHYGLIASGDQVIRSATNAAEVDGRVIGDIMCFEMEAAGIATGYSCIAIRGVSDYADSHKNDAWQHHAAAAAAGCAKELLSYVSLPQPSTETEAQNRLRSELSTGRSLVTQSIFSGQGIQNAGSGNVSIGKDLNIGKN